MINIFSGDVKKDSLMYGQIFTLKGIGEAGIDLRGKFTDITVSGEGIKYYVFKITSHNSEYDEFSTAIPNNGDIVK
jgi:hypothetical protein